MRRLSKRMDLGNGFIPPRPRGSRKLYNYLWELTADLEFKKSNKKDIRRLHHKFLVHIYHSMVRQRINKNLKQYREMKGFIPVLGYLIDAEIGREVNYKILEKAGLIIIKPYSDLAGKSRCYRLVDSVWGKARKIENQQTKKAWKALTAGKPKKYIVVNLRNGEAFRKGCGHKLELRDAHFKTPKLVKNSIKTISPCTFNPKCAGHLVNLLEKAVKRSKKKLLKLKKKRPFCNHPDKTFKTIRIAEEKHFSLEQRYLNLRVCQATMLGQKPKLLKTKSSKGGHLYNYKAAYEPQVSGRLTERHGGMQNANRVFKHLSFINIKAAFNYDLKASQANILSQEIEYCGINNSWIKEYLSDDDAKNTYAKRIGTDTGTWKACLYSTIMGADYEGKRGAVYEALYSFFEFDDDKADIAHQKFLYYAQGLIKSCNQWREKIFTEKFYTYPQEGFTFWKNAIGMRHKTYGKDRNDKLVLMESVYNNQEKPEKYEIEAVTNKQEIARLKRKLAAFILQGREACFIHHLTLLCSEHSPKIKVLRNEHDGIITNKKIPTSLIIKAGKKSGLLSPVLEIKELASDADIKKMRGITNKAK